jgi:hypothetical protein
MYCCLERSIHDFLTSFVVVHLCDHELLCRKNNFEEHHDSLHN